MPPVPPVPLTVCQKAMFPAKSFCLGYSCQSLFVVVHVLLPYERSARLACYTVVHIQTAIKCFVLVLRLQVGHSLVSAECVLTSD